MKDKKIILYKLVDDNNDLLSIGCGEAFKRIDNNFKIIEEALNKQSSND